MVSGNNIPLINNITVLYNNQGVILGYSGADMFGDSVMFIANFWNGKVIIFHNEVFFRLTDLPAMFQVQKFYSWKWHFWSDGFMAQIKTKDSSSGFA